MIEDLKSGIPGEREIDDIAPADFEVMSTIYRIHPYMEKHTYGVNKKLMANRMPK